MTILEQWNDFKLLMDGKPKGNAETQVLISKVMALGERLADIDESEEIPDAIFTELSNSHRQAILCGFFAAILRPFTDV